MRLHRLISCWFRERILSAIAFTYFTVSRVNAIACKSYQTLLYSKSRRFGDSFKAIKPPGFQKYLNLWKQNRSSSSYSAVANSVLPVPRLRVSVLYSICPIAFTKLPSNSMNNFMFMPKAAFASSTMRSQVASSKSKLSRD